MNRILAGCLLLAACGGGGDGASNDAGALTEVAAFPAAPRPALDVLILDDDSNSPTGQQPFASAMPALVSKLSARPGGLPDLHVGVVTSDLGTLGGSDVGNCHGVGDNGALVVRGAAHGAVTGQYLADLAGSGSAGARERNYTGDLADVLTAMVEGVGDQGCGFEQSLAALSLALTSPANVGFRRADAGLAVIVLSDEDDCSLASPELIEGSDGGPLGPLDSFRCTRQGVTCDQSLDEVGTKTNCLPSIGNPYMADVPTLAAQITAAEPDPLKRAVAAVVAPPTPFAVELRTDADHPTPIPALAASCTVAIGGSDEVADPAVRTAAWAQLLDGASYTICQADLDATMTSIATQLLDVVDGDPCISGALPADPTCVVTEDTTVIPPCPADGECYAFVEDDTTCPSPGHLRVQITRTVPADPAATIHVRCEL